jgi:transposase, IS30 family
LANGLALQPEERELISRELAHDVNVTMRFLGRLLGREHSAVAKEIKRNGGRKAYRAVSAQERCEALRARPKELKLASSRRLHDEVNAGLAQEWSPEQISARLRKDHPDNPQMRVSHETIYQCIYLQARGEPGTQLKPVLRTGRTRRIRRRRNAQVRGRIRDMINVSERPEEANDRSTPGFWEGDLIIGKGCKSQIATLVERCTRYTMLVRIPYDRTAERVANLLSRKMNSLPDVLKNSITWDQGKELANHKDVTAKTGMPVYFCDPHSPWQRGTNENTNGLLRQYFPKGTDLSLYSQEELDMVELKLNGRPRKVLGWKSPREALAEFLGADLVDLTA